MVVAACRTAANCAIGCVNEPDATFVFTCIPLEAGDGSVIAGLTTEARKAAGLAGTAGLAFIDAGDLLKIGGLTRNAAGFAGTAGLTFIAAIAAGDLLKIGGFGIQ